MKKFKLNLEIMNYLENVKNEINGDYLVASANFNHFDYDIVKAIVLQRVNYFADIDKTEDIQSVVDTIEKNDTDYQGWLENEEFLEAWMCDVNTVTYVLMSNSKVFIVVPLSNFQYGMHCGFEVAIL